MFTGTHEAINTNQEAQDLGSVPVFVCRLLFTLCPKSARPAVVHTQFKFQPLTSDFTNEVFMQ